MKRYLLTTFIVSLAGQFVMPAGQAKNDKAARVVIITGVDWKGHLWKETAPALKKIVEQNGSVTATIVEDPNFLSSDKLFDFDGIVLHFKNYDPLKDEAKAKANLLRFVKQGGGLAVVHYASGAFEGWGEFRNLVGRTQDALHDEKGKSTPNHDKRGPFTIKITDPDHPVTSGSKEMQADDELYIGLTGNRPIHLLATSKSKITGKEHPMAFVFRYGEGRVFHTTLGHDVKALTQPDVSKLIRRGVVWVVTD